MIDYLVKAEQPELHIDKIKPCPKMIPLVCTHRHNGNEKLKCRCCGVHRIPILSALSQSKESKEIVQVMVWSDSIRQGMKNGSQNTQKELVEEDMTVKQLITMFIAQLKICIPHYQEICWMRHLQSTDFAQLEPDTLLIFTDFAAVMALRAFQKKNSSVDEHAINDNFVVIWNRRKVTVKEKNCETESEIEIFNADVHHFFAETISKGKIISCHAQYFIGCSDKALSTDIPSCDGCCFETRHCLDRQCSTSILLASELHQDFDCCYTISWNKNDSPPYRGRQL